MNFKLKKVCRYALISIVMIAVLSSCDLLKTNISTDTISSGTIQLKMRKVQAGSLFIISSADTEGGLEVDGDLTHEVVVTNSYMIGTYEVTQQQWEAVMSTNPSYWKGTGLPVEQVSWYAAVEFCNELSKLFGRQPAYTVNGKNVECDLNKDGFRLPTEAEWEFAARGGGLDDYHVYSGSNSLSEVGWFSENSESKTHPVGQKKPNALGIYDMSGNVWEWCWDSANADYSRIPAESDSIESASSLNRVIRGGSWISGEEYCLSASRFENSSDSSINRLGFRLAVSL